VRAVGRLRGPRRTIRTRILAIAWVPSFVLLAVGIVGAGVLAPQAASKKNFAATAQQVATPTAAFQTAAQLERQLTIAYLVDPTHDRTALDAERAKTDAGLALIGSGTAKIANTAPASFKPSFGLIARAIGALPQLRQQVDAGQMGVREASTAYSQVLDSFDAAFQNLAAHAGSAEIATQFLVSADLFRLADWRSQSDALVTAAYSSTGLTDQEFAQYVDRVGGYHSLLEVTIPRLSARQQAEFQALMTSPAWLQLSTVEETAVRTAAAPRAGSTHRAAGLTISHATWQDDSAQVGQKLTDLYLEHSSDASQLAVDQAQRQFLRSLFAGIGLLLLSVLVFAVVTRMSTRLIGRLHRLQRETLELAIVRLPAMVERLRGGAQVDVESELPPLDHGKDEIGQVADAFNQAQRTAVTAAAKEAETRRGTAKVFLNIAHRNQVIVHQQLKVLDQAERTQEDPDQLNMLFELDHLATRARRNAENLIILGGGQPGRRWRNPVPLLQVVRSAIGEAERYTRVSIVAIPQISMTGAAVADLIHLLAELVDNATTFSPPSARVEVRGNLVGRGVVIEIEDQGLGIEPEQLEELNSMLESSPDFGIMALSAEPRLGLFVVTQLAARHGVHVTLTESRVYGGTRAVVLIPLSLIAAGSSEQPEIDSDSRPAQWEPLGITPGGSEITGPRMPTQKSGRVIALAPAEAEVPPLPQGSAQGQDQRPALPRRTRQAHLAPQLLDEKLVAPPPSSASVLPSAEHARDRLAAFQRGTRQGRESDPDPTL
jgi:signal transduction histidine kinase